MDTFLWDLQLSALDDFDVHSRSVVSLFGGVLDNFDYVVAFEDFAKDHVAAIEPAWKN